MVDTFLDNMQARANSNYRGNDLTSRVGLPSFRFILKI